ncbi:MAG: carboxypeptidase-like regulatory domain-containing protein, partial [Bacteroidales bacterium]|nr:carboxypeptidase-like regulatory domain-containing protein [Bacteroidales bacterium]
MINRKSPISTLAALTAALFLSLIFPTSLSGQPGGMQFHIRGGGPGNSQQGPRMAFITGKVYLAPDDVEEEEAPGVGVTVTVFGKKVGSNKVDTLYTVVGDKGRFYISNLAPGDVYVKFSMVGYEEIGNAMKLVAGPNEVLVNLQPQKEMLDAAVKKETVSPVSVKGDTIVFHAAAVKTNKGENAIDVLEQMPGVEVTTSSVTVLGEEVQQVYIDGALLFGSAPMRALNNLPAEEVVSIKSFQEYANKDPNHKISKNESKQRVLDISTKSKMKGVFVVNAIAGAGYDTDTTFHKFRYRGGVSAMYFSEALQTHLTVNTNNINDESNRQRGNTFRTAGGGGAAD